MKSIITTICEQKHPVKVITATKCVVVPPAFTNFKQVRSPDTHDRFVTHHAEAKRKCNIWSELSQNTFTVASVYNFDMLQSYSALTSNVVTMALQCYQTVTLICI